MKIERHETVPKWEQDIRDAKNKKTQKVKKEKQEAKAEATSKPLKRKKMKRSPPPAAVACTPAALTTDLDSMSLARLLKDKIQEEAAQEGADYNPSRVGRLLFTTVMGMANGYTLLGWTQQEAADEAVTTPLPIVDLIVDRIKHIAGAKDDLIKKLKPAKKVD